MAIDVIGGFQIDVILNLGEYLKLVHDGINISIYIFKKPLKSMHVSTQCKVFKICNGSHMGL